MAGIEAENLSNEFLRNFIPETLYLVDGDIAPAIPVREVVSQPENVPADPIEGSKGEETQTQQPVLKSTPSLPKLPKQELVKSPAKYKTIGENKKGVVVLVTLPEDEFAKLPQLAFLNKILGAIGLQPTDVAYLNNVSGAIAKFEDMQQELLVNYIISFASRLDTDIPHEKFTLYNPVNVGNVPVVFSQALAVLENDVEHKKQLWNALKQVFL